jgi:dihydropteroate synthase
MPENALKHKNNIDHLLFSKDGKTIVMGVLNVTPDSFSDGGNYVSMDKALYRVRNMIKQGADIIDIGGESSRPGAEPIDASLEIERVVPVIEAIRNESEIPISIDTYKSETAQVALDAGADFINDISAFRFSDDMIDVAVRNTVPIVMMHMKGTPREMQKEPTYDNVIEEILSFFDERIKYAENNGLSRSKIIIDPGIGFGKRLEDNITIITEMDKFKIFGCPVLIGTSRKSFIEMIHPSNKSADSRVGGSIASMILAVIKGADIVRVHDVEETVEAVKVINVIRG